MFYVSWELGTAAEALLELSWPSLSVFNSSAFPPPSRLNATATPSDVLTIANQCVNQIIYHTYRRLYLSRRN